MKTNPTQCFTKKNEFGFALFGGAVTPVEAGETKRALEYEMRDMEEAVQSGDVSRMQMPFTGDVMNIMTDLRKNWGLVYPEESRKTE